MLVTLMALPTDAAKVDGGKASDATGTDGGKKVMSGAGKGTDGGKKGGEGKQPVGGKATDDGKKSDKEDDEIAASYKFNPYSSSHLD